MREKRKKQEVPEHKSEPKPDTQPENKPTKEEPAIRSSKPPKKAPLPTNDAHIKKQTRERLANSLAQYHLIISLCTNIGPAGSDAAHTPEECEVMKNEWQNRRLAAMQHRFDTGALDSADVVSVGWAHSPSDLAEALKELVTELR